MKVRLLLVFFCVLISVVTVEGFLKKVTKKATKKINSRQERSTQILDVRKFHLWRAMQNYGSLSEVLATLNEKQVVNGTEGILIRCNECNPESLKQCPVSGSLLWVQDSKTFPGDPEKALHSLPPGLTVKKSSIPGAGLGVWALEDIPACTLFGPYGGELISEFEKTFYAYAWHVSRDGNQNTMVDGENKAKSNWMRYVNCPDFERQQNVVSFEFEGEMFYRTHTRIPAGTELLVWYGKSYGKQLRRMKKINPL